MRRFKNIFQSMNCYTVWLYSNKTKITSYIQCSLEEQLESAKAEKNRYMLNHHHILFIVSMQP